MGINLSCIMGERLATTEYIYFERAQRSKWRAIAVNWVQQLCPANATRYWILTRSRQLYLFEYSTTVVAHGLYSKRKASGYSKSTSSSLRIVLLISIFIYFYSSSTCISVIVQNRHTRTCFCITTVHVPPWMLKAGGALGLLQRWRGGCRCSYIQLFWR